MPALPITSLYAGVLGLVLLWLSIQVVRARVSNEVSLGDGGHSELRVAMRGQANFVEYVPMALILLGLAEANGSSPPLLHALGTLLVVARIAHPLGLADAFEMVPARFIGTIVTFAVIVVASAKALVAFVASSAP